MRTCLDAQGPGTPGAVIRLSFDSDDHSVGDALDQLDRALSDAGVSADLILSTRIVLAEVFNNIVEHAYGDSMDGTIAASVRPGEGGLACEIRDSGAPMPDGPLPGASYPVLDAKAPMNWPEGGFGWAMVREMTSCLCYARSEGENVLRFRIMAEAD
ncbi:MAG: ATP-binding protein [Pseudomonadota bacterium]